MNLHHRPLFLLTIVYIFGIICAVQASLCQVVGMVVVGVMLFAGTLRFPRTVPRPVLGVLVAVFAVGFIRTGLYSRVPADDVSRYAEGKLVHLTGTVASDPESSGGRTSFVMDAARVRTYVGEYRTTGRVQVSLYRSQYGEDVSVPAPSYGEMLTIHGRLRVPMAALSSSGFDYGRYLARQRVFCTLSAGENEVAILAPAPRSVNAVASRFRSMLERTTGRLFPPIHGGLLLGILLGNYASLPLSVQSGFMRSGTMHLLAASGYNCGIVVLMVGWIMRKLTAPRSLTHLLLIISLWIFTLVVGPSPSIVRAAVMVSAFLTAYLLWRAPDMINVVFFAALIILAANPLSLFDVGFQLSFAAVLSIVLMMPMVEGLLTIDHAANRRSSVPIRCVMWLLQVLCETIALSLSAMLATWPITAYYFNYLSILSIPANVFTALLVIALTVTGVSSLALGLIWMPLGRIAASAASWVAGSMLTVVERLGSQPWSSLSVRSPSIAVIAIYYLAMLGVLEYAHRKAACAKRTARAD